MILKYPLLLIDQANSEGRGNNSEKLEAYGVLTTNNTPDGTNSTGINTTLRSSQTEEHYNRTLGPMKDKDSQFYRLATFRYMGVAPAPNRYRGWY